MPACHKGLLFCWVTGYLPCRNVRPEAGVPRGFVQTQEGEGSTHSGDKAWNYLQALVVNNKILNLYEKPYQMSLSGLRIEQCIYQYVFKPSLNGENHYPWFGENTFLVMSSKGLILRKGFLVKNSTTFSIPPKPLQGCKKNLCRRKNERCHE